MKTELINILNLSCGGCVKTITKKLMEIEGVEKAEVNLTKELVSIQCNDAVERTELCQKLLSIGYPEASEQNSLLTQIKSVGSCLTGKLS
jgi:copper chaperone